MERSDRRVALVLLAAGLTIALLGQYLTHYRREVWPASGLALLLAGGTLVALAVVAARPALQQTGGASRTAPWGQVWALAALALTIGAIYLLHWRASRYGVALWMGATLLALLAAWQSGKVMPGRREMSRREVAGVCAVFALALALRLVGLPRFPRPMSGDEGSMALEAARILGGQWVNPFGTGWFSHPNVYFYLLAASLRTFGWTLFALRLPSAVLGALAAPAVYLLGRGLFGRETAWAGAALMAGWALPLHLSRLALNNSADAFFAAVVLLFLQRGLVRGERWAFGVSGLALGLSLHFYFGARLLVALVPVVVLLGGWQRARRHWQGVLVLVGVAAIVAAPLGVHYLRHPDDFVARAATDGLFQTGQLAAEHAATGQAVSLLFLEHVARAALAFVFTLDRGYFYTDTAPMLQALSGALFVVGVALALARRREPRYAALLVWLGIVVLVTGGLIKSPPGYHRYLVAAPAVCLLVGRAGAVTLRRFAQALHLHPAARRGALAVLAALLVFSGAWYYFAVYAPSGNFADHNTEIADRAAQAMVALGPAYCTYFLGEPLMQLVGFNSVRFLAPHARWADALADPPAGWDTALASEGVLFIALPSRVRTLLQVRNLCPGGVYDVAVGRDAEVLFHTYQLPPGSACVSQMESP
ncbi:MAG: glycosyltransferase family 39 protein [Anaerolineae bacterium]|nr:glycosyltransferase family 39 protein [Anaerolineae bacterium]